jgi:RNA polymerase sigma-70 factor, ECF subfamily
MPTDPNHPGSLTPAGFAEAFRHCSPTLWCIAAAVLGERTHAEDVLQEAAMIGLGKLGAFVPHTSFPAWMGQIVRFTALNHRRKLERRARSETVSPAPDVGVSAPAQRGEAGFDARTAAALGALGETARMCLLLKTVLELEYTEIAEALGIPQGTAMSHVHRARAQMRALLLDDATTMETP